VDRAKGLAYFGMDKQRDFNYMVGQQLAGNLAALQLWNANINAFNTQIVQELMMIKTSVEIFNLNRPSNKLINTISVSHPQSHYLSA
jgi:hypothetical protein